MDFENLYIIDFSEDSLILSLNYSYNFSPQEGNSLGANRMSQSNDHNRVELHKKAPEEKRRSRKLPQVKSVKQTIKA
ncbi:Protein CBG27446 [Caenorhabditis briggsae]|uniref:Protein CBG27446 n=1 Tax=Caenorhabditis briggsae TaxID=6238 RepID=B6IK23_CAEBR|nr:Protein CBG27446 [Caenorhabditis briggsae]CAS00253.1 Protein CBG27446 [Caenorhabditis briggsae]